METFRLMELKVIARIKTDFPTKFGIPRQSGMSPLQSIIVFEKNYRREEALRGISEYEYLWLIWGFDRAEKTEWSPTVRPPRLGGNVRMGVFATRSPYRPNPLALSCVKLEKVENTKDGNVLVVSGADMANDSPIYDIKPYLPFCESHPEAKFGFAEKTCSHKLQVSFENTQIDPLFPIDKIEPLKNILEYDPRPPYHEDGRVYGFEFSGFEIKFSVIGNTLSVISVQSLT